MAKSHPVLDAIAYPLNVSGVPLALAGVTACVWLAVSLALRSVIGGSAIIIVGIAAFAWIVYVRARFLKEPQIEKVWAMGLRLRARRAARQNANTTRYPGIRYTP